MDKILNYLGLSRRINNLIIGTDNVIKALQDKKIDIIFLANDASINTKDKIIKKAFFYNILVVEKYSSLELCKSTGLNNTYIFGINNLGITNKIKELI